MALNLDCEYIALPFLRDRFLKGEWSRSYCEAQQLASQNTSALVPGKASEEGVEQITRPPLPHPTKNQERGRVDICVGDISLASLYGSVEEMEIVL